MQVCTSHDKAIHPFVRPSVQHMHVLWQSERSSANILMPYERPIHLVFWHEEWLVGDVPFYLKFWIKLALPRFKNGDFPSIFAHIASALTRSAWKCSITCKSTTTFITSLRCTAYAAPNPQQGVHKCKLTIFCLKSVLLSRKSAAKFHCVKTFSRKVVRHSLAYI